MPCGPMMGTDIALCAGDERLAVHPEKRGRWRLARWSLGSPSNPLRVICLAEDTGNRQDQGLDDEQASLSARKQFSDVNAIAALIFAIVSSVGVCIGSAAAASFFMADRQPGTFDSLSASDLWTTVPRRIDRSTQEFQRLPALYSTYVTEAPKVRVAVERPLRDPSLKQYPQPVLSEAHRNWCSERYRSFDPVTDSYRAYSGETRPCTSPYALRQPREDSKVASGIPNGGPKTAVDTARAARCAARYQSYRAEDNTYQPYDGPRRECRLSALPEVASAQR